MGRRLCLKRYIHYRVSSRPRVGPKHRILLPRPKTVRHVTHASRRIESSKTQLDLSPLFPQSRPTDYDARSGLFLLRCDGDRQGDEDFCKDSCAVARCVKRAHPAARWMEEGGFGRAQACRTACLGVEGCGTPEGGASGGLERRPWWGPWPDGGGACRGESRGLPNTPSWAGITARRRSGRVSWGRRLIYFLYSRRDRQGRVSLGIDYVGRPLHICSKFQ